MAIPTWAYSNLHAKVFFAYLGCVCFSVKYFPGVKYFQLKIFLRKENIF